MTRPRFPRSQQRLAASGLAVALVPMSTGVDQATVAAIRSACGAVVLDYTAADFQQRLTDFVSAATARAKTSGYRFAYRLPAEQQANQATRTASVSLASRPAVAVAASYAVPAAASRGNLGIAGLYLELHHRDGCDGSPAGCRGRGSTASATRWRRCPPTSMRRATCSTASSPWRCEPGSPTSGANAEDWISGMLSFEPLLSPSVKTQADALAAGKQIQAYASTLSAMVEPLKPSAGGPTVVPRGLRVVVMTETQNEQAFTRRLDVVPDLNLSVAASTDAAAAFAATLEQTLRVSLREALLMPSSASRALSGVPLQYLAPSAAPSTLAGFTAVDLEQWGPVLAQYGGWHRLVPTTPHPARCGSSTPPPARRSRCSSTAPAEAAAARLWPRRSTSSASAAAMRRSPAPRGGDRLPVWAPSTAPWVPPSWWRSPFNPSVSTKRRT